MKPNSEKAVLKFSEDTLREVDADKCPFLQETLARKGIAILEAGPKDLDGEAWRMWETKMRYAFYMAINPRFNRKKFAFAFGIAYGTARNWKNDKKVVDSATKLACQFVGAYVDEVKRLVGLPRGNESLAEYVKRRNTALHKLFAEAALYKNGFLVELLVKTMNELGREQAAAQQNEADLFRLIVEGKGDEIAARKITKEELMQAVGGPSFGIVMAVCAFFRIRSAFYGIDDVELLDRYNEFDLRNWKLWFELLRGLIMRGKTEEAIEAAEAIEQEANQLLGATLFLEKELLKVKHGKK
jgi:hypothetical protein